MIDIDHVRHLREHRLMSVAGVAMAAIGLCSPWRIASDIVLATFIAIFVASTMSLSSRIRARELAPLSKPAKEVSMKS